MLTTSVYLRKTIIHHPTPDPTVLIERVTETRDLNSGHIASQATPLPPGYVGSDPEEKAALAKLAPMPSGHRTALVGRGWRGTQEEYDARKGSPASPAHAALAAAQAKTGPAKVASPAAQKANAAQAAALRAAMRPPAGMFQGVAPRDAMRAGRVSKAQADLAAAERS